jgi:hypothetical protein
MENLFSGLLLYEITLLLLGVFLFLILCIGLLYYIIKKEQIKKLLMFFFVPIIMIGYPSIKEISISKDRIALIKYQDLLVENPSDSLAMEKVEEYTEKLEGRASSAEDLVQISKSKLLLGNNKEAVAYANQALVKDTTNLQARDLRNLVTAQERMEAQVRRQPTATRDTARLKSMIQDVEVTDDLNNLKPYIIRRNLQIK